MRQGRRERVANLVGFQQLSKRRVRDTKRRDERWKVGSKLDNTAYKHIMHDPIEVVDSPLLDIECTP
jgi:hypothetical protein